METKELFINEKNTVKNLLTTEDKCDKYDYFIAAGCGIIGGVVDVFLVGAPGASKLQSWTDEQADKAVYHLAKMLKWKPRSNETDDVSHAIDFLQRTYKVNYDQSVGKAAESVLGITPNNHHMKSIAHSPDIIGLFFSILNQFTSTSSFIAGGKIATMDTDPFELHGNTFGSKLFFGIVNWIGHLLSDFAGSSSSKGRGIGICMPFYELFGLFDVDNCSRETVADIATKLFENGYDARFGIVASIPLVITELSIKLIWALRQGLQYKKPLKECIPTRMHADLRVMLIVGNGTLCVIDAVDAGIESGGTWPGFFAHLNIPGWYMLIQNVIIEICIRVGINADFDAQIEAFQRINQGLVDYLAELKKVDIVRFEEENKRVSKFESSIKNVTDEESLNSVLINYFEENCIDKPWDGEFDAFMGNRSNVLVFK